MEPQRGRPRSERADRAILRSALRLLAEQGYARMSIEAVAADAGVGKTTVYRRFRDKGELVLAALESLAVEASAPDTGCLRNDLLEVMRQSIELSRRGPMMSILGTILVEQRTNPELIDEFRRRVQGPRRMVHESVLRRGIERGEARPDTDMQAVTEMMVGALMARTLSGRQADAAWVEHVVDTVVGGIRAPGGTHIGKCVDCPASHSLHPA